MSQGYKVCGYVYCTKVFMPRTHHHRFCSIPCQKLAIRMRHRKTPFERLCKWSACRKPFRPYRMQVFCSDSCRIRNYYESKRKDLLAYQRQHYRENREKILKQKAEYYRRRKGSAA